MKSIHRIAVVALAASALIVSSCAPGGRSPSGFLRNYKQLDAGYGTEDAVSAYVKPALDLKQYDSVIIDPVTTVFGTPGISNEVKEQIAACLADAMRAQTGGKLKIATAPGPNVLRVRTALTDIYEGYNPGPAVTTVHANPKATLTGKLGSEAVASFMSHVAFEGEILDSVTGERLCAKCDHRLGKKREATPETSWAAVRSAANVGVANLWKRIDSTWGQ